MKKYYI